MPNDATLNQLVTRVRTRGDVVGSSSFDDVTELKPWLKGSLSQFHEMLIQRWNDYYAQTAVFSLIAGQGSYSLPSDFRCLQECFLNVGASARQRLRSFNTEEFGQYGATPPGLGLQYRIVRNAIAFSPTPAANAYNAITLLYTPAYRASLLDYSPVDDVFPNGWEEWVVLDVLQKMNVKVRLLNMDDILKSKAMVEDRVLRGAVHRDSDAPRMRNRYRMGTPAFYSNTGVGGPLYWSRP